jgi:hypothetical protein
MSKGGCRFLPRARRHLWLGAGVDGLATFKLRIAVASNIGMSGFRDRARTASSNPVMPGMAWSVMIKSGFQVGLAPPSRIRFNDLMAERSILKQRGSARGDECVVVNKQDGRRRRVPGLEHRDSGALHLTAGDGQPEIRRSAGRLYSPDGKRDRIVRPSRAPWRGQAHSSQGTERLWASRPIVNTPPKGMASRAFTARFKSAISTRMASASLIPSRSIIRRTRRAISVHTLTLIVT